VLRFEPMTYESESECATHYTTAPHWQTPISVHQQGQRKQRRSWQPQGIIPNTATSLRRTCSSQSRWRHWERLTHQRLKFWPTRVERSAVFWRDNRGAFFSGFPLFCSDTTQSYCMRVFTRAMNRTSSHCSCFY